MEELKQAVATVRELIRNEATRKVRAHAAGQRAKDNGWMRVSPYYESPIEDEAFYQGYDGA